VIDRRGLARHPIDLLPARPPSRVTSLIRRAALLLRSRPYLGRAALMLIPDVRWRIDLPEVGPFQIRLRRNRSYWLRDPLRMEHFPFAMLRQLVRPGDVVYDIGANLGLYTRYLASVLAAGEVVAFEPASYNLAALAHNLALGGVAERVQVLAVALADRDEIAAFQIDDMQSSSGTLDRVTGGEPAEGRRLLRLAPRTEQVVVRRLDTVMEEEGLEPPQVVKVDVEGAEAMVLRGAAGLLREESPRLLIELHGVEAARGVLTLLHDCGYACCGKVNRSIHPGGYGPVGPHLIPHLADPYDIHFIVAACDAADLPRSYSAPDP
jgi:FkbM family methyltransferase